MKANVSMWSARGPANESDHRCTNTANLKFKQWACQMYVFDHMIIKHYLHLMPPVWQYMKLLAATNWSLVSNRLLVTVVPIKNS